MYGLYHFREIKSSEQEFFRYIGFFHTKKKASNILNKFKKFPGFQDVAMPYDKGDDDQDEFGF